MRSDVLNPHYKSYYEGRGTPSDWEAPVPIQFLVVPERTRWRFTVVIDPQRLHGQIPLDEALRETKEALSAALGETGLGAKTSSGYGLFDSAEEPEVQKSAGEAAKGGEEAWEPPKPSDCGQPSFYLERMKAAVKKDVFIRLGKEFVRRKVDSKQAKRQVREKFPELFD